MQSASEALKRASQQQEENAQKFIKANEQAATACEACLKGLRPGRKPNGYYIARPETAESVEVIGVCQRRDTCEKLLTFDADRKERLKKSSGMPESLLAKTVNGFMAVSDYQKAARTMTASYVTTSFEKFKNYETAPWLFLGGQSGCGKTHLCAASASAFINKGRLVKYCAYSDLSKAVSAFDHSFLDSVKRARILFLDDLFKIDPNAGEMKAAFDLIDYRYRYNLQTIISSEKTLDEIEQIDAAIAGRIMEKCGLYFMGIAKDSRKNFRKENRKQC